MQTPQKSKTSEKITALENIKHNSLVFLENLKKLASEELTIDDHDLDTEALKTPKLHTRWLDLLSQSAIRAKSLKSTYNKFYLERWKYYSGTATDKYYADYGQVNVKIQKSDMSLYLDADEMLCILQDAVEAEQQAVAFCEKVVKEVSSRTFHIKSAIDWRRFTSGS